MSDSQYVEPVVHYQDGWILIPYGVDEMSFETCTRIPMCQLVQGGCAIPMSRKSILCVELAGDLKYSPEYVHARNAHIGSFGEENIPGVIFALRSAGVSEELFSNWQLRYIAGFAGDPKSFNASEQGTGKTRAALGLLIASGLINGRVLLAAPNSLIPQWKEELYENLGVKVPFHMLNTGTKLDRIEILMGIKNGIVAINYEVLVDMLEVVKAYQPQAVMFDESWMVQNPTSGMGRAAKIIGGLPSVQSVQCLNGTPYGTHAGNLWNQLAALNSRRIAIDVYGRFLAAFTMNKTLRMGERKIDKPYGVTNPTGLVAMIEPVWYRVPKSVCNLPPKRYHKVMLDMPAEMRIRYEQVKEHGENALPGGESSLNGEGITKLRLQQISGGHIPNLVNIREAVLSDSDQDPQVQLAPLECNKIRWLRRFAEDRLVPHPTVRTIVWCRFSAEIRRVREELAHILGENRVKAADGNTDAIALQDVKKSFQSRHPDGVQVIVAQIRKMAWGHNLQAADHMVMFNHTWRYVERSQLEDRAHRQGRTEPVDYWDLCYRNSVDEDVLKALEAHEDFASQTVVDTIVKDFGLSQTMG